VLLRRRLSVLLAAVMMLAMTLVAGPLASSADADHIPKSQGKNSGWGDGSGHGRDHPKKGGGDPTPF
jgi:hypothetical protein